MGLLGLGGAALRVFFESATPYLLALTAVSLGYSFYLVYRRPFRPSSAVRRVCLTAMLAGILSAIPLFRN